MCWMPVCLKPTMGEIWSFALENDWVIITKDDDFQFRASVSKQHPRIVWVRVGNCSKVRLIPINRSRRHHPYSTLSPRTPRCLSVVEGNVGRQARKMRPLRSRTSTLCLLFEGFPAGKGHFQLAL